MSKQTVCVFCEYIRKCVQFIIIFLKRDLLSGVSKVKKKSKCLFFYNKPFETFCSLKGIELQKYTLTSSNKVTHSGYSHRAGVTSFCRRGFSLSIPHTISSFTDSLTHFLGSLLTYFLLYFYPISSSWKTVSLQMFWLHFIGKRKQGRIGTGSVKVGRSKDGRNWGWLDGIEKETSSINQMTGTDCTFTTGAT